jgi:hypothetical protein
MSEVSEQTRSKKKSNMSTSPAGERHMKEEFAMGM